MTIAEQEEKLFEDWKKLRNPFYPDGLADEKEYLASNIRLLFILKETNEPGDNFDLRTFIRDGSRPQTWNNITRWTMGIRRIREDLNWEKDLNNIKLDTRIKFTRSIGAMNLKKSCGGHTTQIKPFMQVALEDLMTFSKPQFDLYKADLVICCGSVTWNLVKGIAKPDGIKQKTTRGIEYYEYESGKFVICYSHPEARVQGSILYYGLIDAVKEILAVK